jgi:formylglycine-generating enzyme required for sulfatase activity
LKADLPEPVPSGAAGEELEFLDIPAGIVLLGSAELCTMADYFDKDFPPALEWPEREVEVSGFRMSRFEVTCAQWKVVYDWAVQNGYAFDYARPAKAALSGVQGHPVSKVNWFEVLKWCNAASERAGLRPCYVVDGKTYRAGQQEGIACEWQADGYRLPTEAEWEYAAHAGNDASYYWGDCLDTDLAWVLEGEHRLHEGTVVGGTLHTVGGKPGNQFGLYDMVGNAWEWCWDLAGPHGMVPADARAWRGPVSAEAIVSYCRENKIVRPGGGQHDKLEFDGRSRIVKGAAFNSPVGWFRGFTSLASRSGLTPETGRAECGFRVAQSGQ